MDEIFAEHDELLAEYEEAVQDLPPREDGDDVLSSGQVTPGLVRPTLDRDTVRSLGRRVVTAAETFPECFDAAERLEAANIDAAMNS